MKISLLLGQSALCSFTLTVCPNLPLIYLLLLSTEEVSILKTFHCLISNCEPTHQYYLFFEKFSNSEEPPEVFCKKRPANFIKKEPLPQVFSCEFCEISKNTFFTENLRTTASSNIKDILCWKREFWKTFAYYESFSETAPCIFQFSFDP